MTIGQNKSDTLFIQMFRHNPQVQYEEEHSHVDPYVKRRLHPHPKHLQTLHPYPPSQHHPVGLDELTLPALLPDVLSSLYPQCQG